MLTETVPAGVLPSISNALEVSDAQSGQLLTVYAVGSLLGAIPLTAATRGRARRPLLIATILVIGAGNIITATSASYALTFCVRLVAGMAAGVQWAMIAGYAMRLVDEQTRGRAIAIAMAGVPLALALGVPMGTALADLLGWRLVFAAMAAAAVGVVLWTRWSVTPFAGEAVHQRVSVRGVAGQAVIAVVLATAFAFEVGHMLLYTYIAPFLEDSGLGGDVGALLLVFGVSAVVGLWLAGMLIDRHRRAVLLTTLAVFSAVMLLLGALSSSVVITVAGIGLWGGALGAAPTAFQAVTAAVAGSSIDVAQSLLVTALNGGMAAGAAIGGVALAAGGPGSLPWLSFIIFTCALVTAMVAGTGAKVSRRAGFPPVGMDVRADG